MTHPTCGPHHAPAAPSLAPEPARLSSAGRLPGRLPALLPLLLAALLCGGPASARAADDDLRAEIEKLEEGQARILEELEELRELVESRPAAPARPAGPDVAGKRFDLGDNPVHGEPTAALTLIEFMDYQCGYCGRHLRQTYPQIASEYVDTGKLRYAVLDLPLENIHQLAFDAAEATHCAADQGKFWEMHERLFDNQRNLEPWSQHAAALGLDVEAFEACMAGGDKADSVRHDMAQARKAGATGTPSFVLGRTDPESPDRVTGIAFIRGARPFADFQQEIDSALESLE